MGPADSPPKLAPFFTPDSIVLVGASAKAQSLGFTIARQLIRSFRGPVHYVNATEARVLGSNTHPSIDDVPAGSHLWIFATIPREVSQTLTQVGARNPAAILLLAEVPDEECSPVSDAITRLRCPVVGPRCAGCYDALSGLDTLAIPAEIVARPMTGNTGVIADNRDLAFGLVEQLSMYRCGTSHVIDLGECLGIDESDVLSALVRDPDTRVILFGCGQIADPSKFETAVNNAHRARKPVIACIFPSKINEILFLHRRCGPKVTALTQELATQYQLLVTNSWGRAVDLALFCQKQPIPQGPGVAVISNFGAYCVNAANVLHDSQLQLAAFDADTLSSLKDTLPPYCRSENPVCLYSNADEIRLDSALRLLLPDPTVHSVLLSLLPNSPFIDPDYLNVMLRQRLLTSKASKPILAVVPAVERENLLIQSLEQVQIPVFSNTHRAVTTLENAYRYKSLMEQNP
jgi:acyl-CoA synthetase (NDP forming)